MKINKLKLFLSTHSPDYYEYNFWKKCDYQYIERFKQICLNTFDCTTKSIIEDVSIFKEPNEFISIDKYIRRTIIKNAKVTIVFIDNESWKMKDIDIEISSTLLDKDYIEPIGLIAIILPSFNYNTSVSENIKHIKLENNEDKIPSTILPKRLVDNLDNGFVKIYKYTEDLSEIKKWINESIIRSQYIKPNNNDKLFEKNLFGNGWDKNYLEDEIKNRDLLVINNYI